MVTGWPAGTTLNQTPDWSWRLKLALDDRPDDTAANARPEKIRVGPITPDVNPQSGDPHAAYRKVLARHVEIFKKGAARRVVWDSNIGIVRFARDGAGNITATQDLLYWLAGDETTEEPEAFTAYSESLEPTGAARPAIP